MALPIDLVLVRHGQSEENAAKRLSESGNNSIFTNTFRDRHTASFRLTKAGRNQARRAGIFLSDEFPQGFDRYITSEYNRAMETAGLLGLPNAEWFCDFYLTGRDWGEIDVLPEDERRERLGKALRRQKVEPFFWRPPNGESFADVCFRVDRVLDTLHRECSGKRVLIVCHGEVMWAFRVKLERMSQIRFKELNLSKQPEHRIYNCQILHYSRKNPKNGKLAPFAEWVRHIRPTDTPPTIDSDWQKIKRPRYSNSNLIKMVSQTPCMIE